jgi:hypothetical protein
MGFQGPHDRSQNPLEPVNLAFHKSSNLIVLSNGGMRETVYARSGPGTPDDEISRDES